MKKFLTILFLIFLISSLSFADTFIPSEGINGFPKFTVKLAIEPSDMFFYSFGFSNEEGIELPNNGENNIPNAAGSFLKLTYDPISFRAFNDVPLFLWYKAWTDQNFSLKIETVGNMISQVDDFPELGWHISLSKVDGVSSNDDDLDNNDIYSKGDSSAEIRITPKEEGEVYSAYKMNVTTDEFPQILEKADLAGTIKMSVEAE